MSFTHDGDGQVGPVGDYSLYSFEQVINAIFGGFDNDPAYVPVDPNTIYNAVNDIGIAGNALINAGQSLKGELRTLLGTTDKPLWTGDAANEFAAIMFAVLTWLDDCATKIGHEYTTLVGGAGDNLVQAQLGLAKICDDAVNAWNAANPPPDPTYDYIPVEM